MAITQGSWSPVSGMRENWLFQIDDSSGSNKKYYSFFDQTVNSVNYLGVVVNTPKIRERINIFKSSSSLSNLQLEIDNSGNVAEDFLYGTNDYLNRDVRVYSCLESGTVANFNNIPLIYTGTIESITHNEGKVNINIVSPKPWDGVQIPNTYTVEKVPVPIIYGDYTGNSSIYAGSGTDNWHPAPYTKTEFGQSHYTAGTSGSSLNPSHYVASVDGFIPFNNASASTTTVGSSPNVTVPENAIFEYAQAPSATTTTTLNSNITEGTWSNLYDKNDATGVTITYDENVQTDSSKQIIERVTIPATSKDTKASLKYKVTTLSGVNQEGGFPNVSVTLQGTDIVTVGNGLTRSHTATTGSMQQLDCNFDSSQTTIDIRIVFEGEAAEDTSGGEVDIVVTLYELTTSNEISANDIEKVYVETDGNAKSWSSGTCTKMHEFHRDILYRYLGITTIDTTSYNALDTARSWTGRLWELEPTSIKGILDKLAYEGGFIYHYTVSGTIKYIFVKNSYSSADHTLDSNDVGPLSISHTPISDILTHMTVNYDKHPAKDSNYRSQVFGNNSSARTKYNLTSNQGKKTVELDYLVTLPGDDITAAEENPNDGFLNYYGNISTTPRTIIRANVVNPAHFDMEVGDITSFGSMIPTKAFNKSFSNRYFMAIELTRSSGSLQVTWIDVTPNT